MNNINSRYKRMDEFLKLWRDVALQNPNLSFSEDRIKNAIYKYLTRLGVREEEQKTDLANEGVFDRWIERYRNIPNIDVYVTDDWKYFCQFTNKKEAFEHGRKEAIKVYIPLDHAHIETGANLIFDFLAKKDVAHQSKIGKNIRFDDIVVRLNSEQDAKDLLHFVNSQKYIQEGLIAPNPFAYNNNQIALACDRCLSYNSTIASLIAIYIERKKQEGTLNKVKLSDFVGFVAEYHKERFGNFEKQEETLKDFQIASDNLSDYDISSKILNLKEVTTLFLGSTNLLFSFNNYLKHYQNGKDTNKFEQQVSALVDLRRKTASTVRTERTPQIDINATIMEIIKTVSEQFDEEYAIAVIETYLKTGNEDYLTRKNNIRQKVANSEFRNLLNNYLRENNVSFRDYYSIIENEKDSNYLEQAVLATYDKYQRKYELGEEKITGKKWTEDALFWLMNEGSYKGFTRDNGARDNLLKNVSRKEAISIMREKTSYPTQGNDYISEEESRMLAQDYLSRVLTDRMERQRNKTVA